MSPSASATAPALDAVHHVTVVRVLSVPARVATGPCAALIRPFRLAVVAFLVLVLTLGGIERLVQREAV